MTYHLLGGLDIGNGYVKGTMDAATSPFVAGYTPVTEHIDIPSSTMMVMRPNRLPVPDAEAVATISAPDFYNQLDASFATDVIADSYRRLFGARALTADGSFEEFDVIGRKSKAEQELSAVLVLGLTAARAVRAHVLTYQSVPVSSAENPWPVTVDVLALALPINEFLKHRKAYAEMFTGPVGDKRTHIVTINNFETPITVALTFESVKVVAEGAPAQYAINAKGEPLMQALLADVRSRGLALEGVTAADVLAATNSIGVDIGEGTVNFPVFTSGRFNPDASMTFTKGYGSVLTDALTAMSDAGFAAGFTSRKQLAAYLNEKPTALKRAQYERVMTFVNDEIDVFCKEVALQFSRVLEKVGAMTEVVYVYGGGASAVKEALYPHLFDKAQEMSAGLPVMYLDASYSRKLNRSGLYLVATSVLTQK